ncbi:restriction endonuclease subunit S [Holdemanella sp. MSK.7.32]|uniref:restriction endonuclease subunit S n=1 Tax=Holdemanella sp. MSK.7.32 TaxID=2965273 RepID=UPI002108884C|nr:restriction endonuclease subunit S [Holdemanella sp. MSK.7.32]MCQ4804236.1 restriction endonuclease subunit S [Holdemanella sp. MSK.7.32]
MKLSDRDWKEFFLEDIFSVGSGKRLTNADKIDGTRPFIGATDNMNGVTGFVDNENSSLDNNVLGVNYNGAPCIGFYHPYECIFTDDVKRLHLKNHEDNQYVLLFFKTIILQQKNKYCYGYKFNERRMLRQIIVVPVDDNDEPDYQFMEDYMKELMTAKRKQYQEYVEQRLVKLGVDDMKNTEVGGENFNLESREWKPCRLSKLGKVESGRDIYAMERVEGDIPYITSGSQNNGIGYFVSNKNDTFDKDYIAFNRNGAVGLAFYHPYWSVMGNDCRKIHISKADENMYVGLFIATAISMQSKSFGYSRKLGTARANKLQIMLPVDDNNEPDYEFMEECGRKIMAKKYIQYLKYLESTCESSDLLLK